LTNIWIVL